MSDRDNYWKNYWEQEPQNYSSDYELDRGHSCDPELEQLIQKKLISFIDPKHDDVVFDAGCGTGINCSVLHNNVKEMVGMDFSQGMIDRANERMKREHIQNVKLLAGSITDTKLSSNKFNKIICISVFQYLNDQECIDALQEFIRISKNNAIIILHVKNLTSLYFLTLLLGKKIKGVLKKNVKRSYYYRSRRWYEEKLSMAGINILDYYSANIIQMDFIPDVILNKLRRLEMKYIKGKFLNKFGADYLIKAEIVK